MKPHYLTAAKAFLNEEHSKAKCAFIAGSVTRGEQTATSDIDLVIVYDTDILPKAYRNSLIYQGWPIETFVQNENSVAYFFRQDAVSGTPALINMIACGIMAPENACALNLRKKALDIETAGPFALTAEEINQRRYAITDALDDIAAYKTVSELHGSLCQLRHDLADFYLRANKKWSGKGKSLVRALQKAFPEISDEYESAFKEAFNENIRPVSELADRLLMPFGGRLWAGWKSDACDEANLYSSTL